MLLRISKADLFSLLPLFFWLEGGGRPAANAFMKEKEKKLN